MFGRIFGWIKKHKLVTGLVVVIILLAALLIGSLSEEPLMLLQGPTKISMDRAELESAIGMPTGKMAVFNEAAPRPDITERKVITNSNFSLLVKNVTDTVEKIKEKTQEMAGYVINTRIDRGEFGETAYVEIRVPTNKIDEISSYFRGLAVKVISENVSGVDITDQYVDFQERIKQLEAEKVAFQGFFAKAANVNDMMRIQQAIFQVQDQIDAYKGRLMYMEGASKTSKLTVAISTDELGLPYAPAQPWRPEVVFKQAIRSLLTTLQKAGTLGIWLAVYAPLIIIVIVVFRLVTRKKKKSK